MSSGSSNLGICIGIPGPEHVAKNFPAASRRLRSRPTEPRAVDTPRRQIQLPPSDGRLPDQATVCDPPGTSREPSRQQTPDSSKRKWRPAPRAHCRCGRASTVRLARPVAAAFRWPSN